MCDTQRNTFGLFDSPVRPAEQRQSFLTRADIARRLDEGAFWMSREEAVAAGFLNPYDDQETVVVNGGGVAQ